MTSACRLRLLVTLLAGILLASFAWSDAPNHFVVVIAASAENPGDASPLHQAQNEVGELLFKPGKVISGRPWYRFGHDYMTLIESGPGPRSTEDASAAKEHWGQVEFDYARPVTRPQIRIRQSRFEQLFHPSPRPHVNNEALILAAGLPLWTGDPKPVENTYLVMLEQLPSSRPYQSALVQNHFAKLGSKFTISNRNPTASFSNGPTQFNVFKAQILGGQRPSVPTGSHRMGRLRTYLGIAAKAVAVLSAVALAGFLLKWTWTQRTKAQPFELWIPGFATGFTLPSISKAEPCNFRARLPRYAGEPAVHLQLPGRAVRLLFYSRARLTWDPRLRVDGLDPAISAYPLRRLPRFVRFVWVERPGDEGNLHISVDRPRMLGGSDRIDITVNFLALPKPEPES